MKVFTWFAHANDERALAGVTTDKVGKFVAWRQHHHPVPALFSSLWFRVPTPGAILVGARVLSGCVHPHSGDVHKFSMGTVTWREILKLFCEKIHCANKRTSLLTDEFLYLFGGHWAESWRWVCILPKCTNSALNCDGFSSYHAQEWVGRWNIIRSCTLPGFSSDAGYLFFFLPLALCQTSPAFAYLLSDPPAKSAQK